LARYANSKYWVDFEDFLFYRMDVVDVYYVGGFGVMGWMSASEYDRAQSDLADAAADIIRHMNTDHRDALIPLARVFARIESQEATMTAVDRLGFQRMLSQSSRRGFGHDAEHDVEAEADGERYQDAGLQAAGRTVRLLRVHVRAMLLVEDGSGLFRNDSVEETGATHL
jgi:hypothetical protein